MATCSELRTEDIVLDIQYTQNRVGIGETTAGQIGHNIPLRVV